MYHITLVYLYLLTLVNLTLNLILSNAYTHVVPSSLSSKRFVIAAVACPVSVVGKAKSHKFTFDML